MNYLLIAKLILTCYSLYLTVSIIKSHISIRKYTKSRVTINNNEIVHFKKFQRKVKYCGYIQNREIKILIVMNYFIPVVVLILFSVSNFPEFEYALIYSLLYYISFSLFLYLKHAERNRVIEFNGYKIFKFLLNQISSGILVTDAIKSMYMIVNDNRLRRCLIDVSAYYTQTTDIVKSLNIIKEQYRGVEVDTLCIAIQQGIYTGKNYETMERMESLLFKKYIYHIKRETNAKRSNSFLAVLLLCLIIILMISIPIVIDIFNAFNQIFV